MISYLKSSFVKPDDNICCPDPKHWAILVNKEFFFSPKGYYLILFFAWYLMCIANCGRIIQLTNCGVFWNLKGVLRRSDGFLGKWKHHSPSVFDAFWNLKSVSVGQTFFLEKRSIIPRAKFEIWFSHLKSVYVGQTVFSEKRSIIAQAILCVRHGFVASFCSANHFQANATVAGPYPNDIVSQIVFCQTRRQHLLSRSKALSNK